MPTPPSTRSIKISDDERGGWSSDRPRRDGAPPRPADVSVRSSILRPTDALRYSPGSLLLIVSPSAQARTDFAERIITNRGSLFSLDKVRALIAGRVADEEVEERAAALLVAAVTKRLGANETVVVVLEGAAAEERERFVRIADKVKRPRHLILLDVSGEDDSERTTVNDLRRRLDAGELGAEGFHTALRLSGAAIPELKRIVFAPAPRDD